MLTKSGPRESAPILMMRDKTILFTMNKRIFSTWRAVKDRRDHRGSGTVDLLFVGVGLGARLWKGEEFCFFRFHRGETEGASAKRGAGWFSVRREGRSFSGFSKPPVW